ncbi:hypothetical protein [Microbulbifer sp. SAOS-129_SWC]|uniref:hypothetical protein n=1 Tax=Microbulbifer sp. SAOS-129_SWC TaxID=3145235 RepID=UPI0032164265
MNYFDKTMKIALLLLLALVVVFSFVQFLEPGKFSRLNLEIAFIFNVAWAAVLIAVLRAVKEYRLDSGGLSVWGFLWRALLAKYSGLILSVFTVFILPLSMKIPSIEFTIFIYPVAVIFSVIVAWLFFSENRRLQFRWVLGAMRGY